MKTVFPSKEEALKGRKWALIDAADIPVGRVATKAATLLRGKHRATVSPHVDTGDFVIVVNASRVALTGNKRDAKIYYDYSGFIGGLHETPAGEMLDKKPEEVIRRAVKGMLPSGPLGYAMLKKLKVYAGETHPHASQNPQTVKAQ